MMTIEKPTKSPAELAMELRLCELAIAEASPFFDNELGLAIASAVIRGDTPEEWSVHTGSVRVSDEGQARVLRDDQDLQPRTEPD